MKKLLRFAVLLSVVLFVSCSQQNPPSPVAATAPVESVEAVKTLSREVQALKDENKSLVAKLEKSEMTLEAVKLSSASTERRIEKDWEAFFAYTNATQSSLQLIYDELIRQQNVSSNLALRVVSLMLKGEGTSEIVLDAAEPSGFFRLDSLSGFFLVSLKNVEPYLDGYRVTLHVGNPLSADYESLKFNVSWGKKFDSKEKANDPKAFQDWQASLHFKEISVPDKLLGGAWNKIQLVLSPAKSDELG